MQRYGRIDVLFNVAGINRREGLLDVEPETYDRIMDTNLKGVFFLSQAVAREMYRRRAGNIINIGSHNDTGMLGGCSVYGASKSGVVALTRSMAGEFAQYGIRCNAISPGHILTDLTQVTWQHPTRSEYLRERIAMGRGTMIHSIEIRTAPRKGNGAVLINNKGGGIFLSREGNRLHAAGMFNSLPSD